MGYQGVRYEFRLWLPVLKDLGRQRTLPCNLPERVKLHAITTNK